MLKNKILMLFGAILILATSCKDENSAPIATFDSSTKGAYVRVVEQGNTLVNLLDVAGSSFTYTVEFVDLEQGALVSEYRLQMQFEDNHGGGKSVGPIDFRSWSASDFETSPMGFKGLSNITITGPEVIAAAGLTEADLVAGDNFKMIGSVTTVDGAVYAAANSSASVNGAGFRGFFNFTMPAACPSDLTGTYATTSNSADSWCGNGAVPDGTVEILAQGGGVYVFGDWSFGAYGPCYGAVAAQTTLNFTEVCEIVSITGSVDSYGDTWTFDQEIDGAVWRIKWENTYGEAGETWITHPDGAWPFTLAE